VRPYLKITKAKRAMEAPSSNPITAKTKSKHTHTHTHTHTQNMLEYLKERKNKGLNTRAKNYLMAG
jgi:hypothetical protein